MTTFVLVTFSTDKTRDDDDDILYIFGEYVFRGVGGWVSLTV